MTQRALTVRLLAGPCWFLEPYCLGLEVCHPIIPIDGRRYGNDRPFADSDKAARHIVEIANQIEPGKVDLPGETIAAETVVLAAGIIPNPVVAELPVDRDQRGRIVVDGTMRCKSHPEVWAPGDCAAVPAPDGQPYPSLAQHAMREAKLLARNIEGVLRGRTPQPFVYSTLGMMGSLGHGKAFGRLIKLRVRGVLAWLVRRTYYLLQMPGWRRRVRIMIDWTFALLFQPDIVKISLDSEAVEHLRRVAGADAATKRWQGNGAPSHHGEIKV